MPGATVVARALSAGPRAPLVHAVDLAVSSESRLALTGPNGAGKSTLLMLLAGLEPPESGVVQVAPAAATVGYLPQEAERLAGEPLLGFLARRTGVAAAELAFERASTALGTADPGAADGYEVALGRYLALGVPDFPVRSAQVCADLGLPTAILDRPTAALSGGQLARAGLASVLLSRHDVLLLDEPTNDLDSDGLQRLESRLAGRSGFVVVSHDREFLARTVTDVVELDPETRTTRAFSGGWDAFVAERERARQHVRAAYDEYAGRRDDLQRRAVAQRERARSGAVRAATRMPDNDRAAKGARIESATAGARAVRATERRLAQLDQVQEPRKQWRLQLSFAGAARSGDVVATLADAVVERGELRLGPVDLNVAYGDRIVVTGANGAGKTTLLAALLGRLPLTSGRQHLGRSVAVGELDQARVAFRGDGTVVDIVIGATGLLPQDARTLLAKFGMSATHVDRPAASLSPGERTRAGLAVLAAAQTNLLVLDEPTNHLDLPAIEQLQDALDRYAGTILLVTHDRRLRQALAVTRAWHISGGVLVEQEPLRP